MKITQVFNTRTLLLPSLFVNVVLLAALAYYLTTRTDYYPPIPGFSAGKARPAEAQRVAASRPAEGQTALSDSGQGSARLEPVR
jgi:hypothetical protein